MQWIAEAFQRNWFYMVAMIIGVIYGLGGVVHIGNILGFGELEWSEAPVSWKIGDIWWGALDIVAVVGIVLRSPVGVLALLLAAGSQVIVYTLAPDAFALTAAHRSTLQKLVYFNAIVLVVIIAAVYLAIRDDGACRDVT